MLQAYSNNLDVAAGAAYPFNNVVLEKGRGVSLSGPSTIQINKRGIYFVEVDGFATPEAATTVSTQLYVNGVAQPQAISSFTPASITDTRTFGFKTFVRVLENNCNCNCFTSPTLIQALNGETDVSDAHINVCVTQIC